MKNKIRKVLAMLFIVATMAAFFTLKTSALSLSYSGGSSSNGTGATATTSGFTISYDKAADNICGYRFSIVSTNGLPKSGTKVANVYLSNVTIGSTAYSSGQRFIISSGVVANKKQLANGTKVTSTTTRQSCDYSSGSCGFYSTLPQAPGSVGTWIKASNNSYQNLQRIYVICGSNLSNATESDYVLIEPIFWPKLAGVKTAATATELAIYGANVSGGDGYKGTDGNLYNAGSGTLWNLSNYINREFPNSLYVSSKTDVYAAVTISTSNKYTYKQIIQNGYGCSVLTVKNVVPINQVKIAYNPNGGTTNTELNSNGWIMQNGQTYFHIIKHGVSDDPYNASTFSLTRTGYTFKGWKVHSTGSILDQDTNYASTVYAHYNDANKTTANTSNVICYLYAVWEKTTYTNTISHWAWEFNGNGNNANKNAYKLTSTTFTKQYNDSYSLDESNKYTIPNGFYLRTSYGTSSVTGTWTSFSFGTAITQKPNNMSFEYDYYPNKYNITYDLKGGTNNSDNPNTYNVLYGVTLQNPTKTNAEFLGWDLKIKKDITIAAKNHNYNYNNALYYVKPGNEYKISMDSAKLTTGTAAKFTCLIYDSTAQKTLANKEIAFGDNINYSITCPLDADASHDLRILIYAGVSGSTSGNAAEFKNVTIEFSADGINKGCGSAFTDATDLYNKLAMRITGDVEVSAKWHQTVKELAIVPVEPNAPYRENTEVITSYWIVNLGSSDIHPYDDVSVIIDVYDGDKMIYGNAHHNFPIPANDKNLVYFKWKVPENIASDKIKIDCRLLVDLKNDKSVSEEYAVTPYTVYSTPDTQYEKTAPTGFSIPEVPESVPQYAKWWEYKYNDGVFTKVEYSLGLKNTGNAKIYSESNDNLMDSYLIKSGYPLSTAFTNLICDVSGYTFPNNSAYTYPQYINVKFPEFGYRIGDGLCRTLIYDSMWMFRQNGTYGNVHFIPLYYPDGNYAVVFEKSDLWTPAGMLKAETASNPLNINGNAYNDWYVGR